MKKNKIHVTSCPVTVESGVGVWPKKKKPKFLKKKKIPELDRSFYGPLADSEDGGGAKRGRVASQVLPVDGHKRLIGLLGVADDLGDAMLPPQALDLPVALYTQVEGVPSPAGTARGCVSVRQCACISGQHMRTLT